MEFALSESGEVTGFVMYRNGDHIGNKLPE